MSQRRNERASPRDRAQPTHVQPLFVCSSKATHRTGKRSEEGPFLLMVEVGGVAVGQSSTLPEQHAPNNVTGLRGLVGGSGCGGGQRGRGHGDVGLNGAARHRCRSECCTSDPPRASLPPSRQ